MAAQVSLLGDIEITGVDDASSLTRRDRVVLGALAVLSGEPVSTDQLADALWGDEPPASATKVIQGSVMRLRRAFGASAIITSGSGYRFALDGDTVDTHVFERLVARGRDFAAAHEPARAAAAYEQALSLWRGRPVPELVEWDPGRAEAERLLEVRRAAEEELVEARMQAGRATAAVADARALVAREPHREHRWALLALALYRTGRQRESLDALRRARRTLLDDLGLDPGPELAELEGRILRQDPGLLDVPEARPAPSSSCPWPGLRPFDVDDAELFAGREDDVASCLARLEDAPLLVVVGASGSGKSSLVRAGVVPVLRERGDTVVVLAPGVVPAAALSGALSAGEPPDVVVVDQMEELFAAPQTADVTAFLTRLGSLVEDGTRVIVTLRADYVASLSADPSFARLAERGLALLAPMSEAQLRRAIEEPARRSGLVLEHGLVDLLVRDVVHEAGGLPLMSHALAETWARRDGTVLTVEAYTSTGGIRGAVAQSAERLYESLGTDDRAALRAVLHRLVTPTPTGDPVAARVPTRVFDGTADAPRVLDLLVRARLVTASADTATIAHESLVRAWPRLRTWLDEDVEGQRVLSHLQVAADGWESAGRPEDELYRGARLSTALEWRARSQPLLSPTETEFLDASTAYADSEDQRRSRELAAQKRTNRQLRWSLGGVAGLLMLSLVAGSLAAVNGRRAESSAASASQAAVTADAGRLAFQSQSGLDLDTSLLLARQAVDMSPDSSLRGNLLQALLRDHIVRSGDPRLAIAQRFRDHRFSPDGSRLLATAQDPDDMSLPDTAYLIDTSDGRIVTGSPVIARADVDWDALTWPSGFVDEGRVAVAMGDMEAGDARSKVLRRFDAQTGAPLGAPEPVPGSRSGDFFDQDRISITSDGDRLTSVLDRALRIWDRRAGRWTGPRLVPLPDLPSDLVDQDMLVSTRYDAAGERVAVTVAYQGKGVPAIATTVVDLSDGRVLMPLVVSPWDVTLSPDGTLLAVGAPDGEVALRRVSPRGEVVLRIPGVSSVNALSFSDDGARLGVGREDGGISVYRVSPLALEFSIPAGGSPVRAIALPPDGRRALTMTDSGRVTTYSLDGASSVVASIPTDSAVDQVAADPAGQVVVAGFYDGRVTVYDQSSLAKQRDLTLGPYAEPDPTYWPELHRRVTGLAVTPDGSAVVAADRVGHLRLWSAADGSLLWARDDVPTSWLAVSPDGRLLVTQEFTQARPEDDPQAVHPDWRPITTTVRVWDLERRAELWRDDLADLVGPGDQTPKPRTIAWSADSSRIAAGFFSSRDALVVYDASTGERLLTRVDPESEPDRYTSVAFTPTGTDLAVQAPSGDVFRLDTATGAATRLVKVPLNFYGDLAYSSDGRLLFSLSGYGETVLTAWDAQSSAPIITGVSLRDTDGDSSLAPTADGQLFIGTADGILRLDTDVEHWKRAACEIAGRQLSEDEWRQYLGERPFAPACGAAESGDTPAIPG
jgi:DNA-binding SARP family transcriptional activator/WD40 repeat protein